MAVVGLSQYPNYRFESRICPSVSVKHRFEPIRAKQIFMSGRGRGGIVRFAAPLKVEFEGIGSSIRRNFAFGGIRPFKQFSAWLGNEVIFQ
jgi:hypothetical protein